MASSKAPYLKHFRVLYVCVCVCVCVCVVGHIGISLLVTMLFVSPKKQIENQPTVVGYPK
jgi:hypothetical protein